MQACLLRHRYKIHLRSSSMQSFSDSQNVHNAFSKGAVRLMLASCSHRVAKFQRLSQWTMSGNLPAYTRIRIRYTVYVLKYIIQFNTCITRCNYIANDHTTTNKRMQMDHKISQACRKWIASKPLSLSAFAKHSSFISQGRYVQLRRIG